MRRFGIALTVMLGFQSVALADGLLDQVKSGAPVRVGFAEQEPFISTGPNGELTGYEVDLLQAVIAKIGPSKLEAVPTQFGALIPGLQANRFDVVASDLYIRPDRCKLIAFAEPTHIVNDGLIVLAGNPKKIHSYADVVQDPSIKVGYIAGGGPIADHAIAAGVSKDQLVTLPDFNSLLAAVRTKRIDAFLNTGISIASILKAANDSSVERADPFEQAVIDGKVANATGSYAFRTSDQEFVDEFNKQLSTIISTGEAAKIGAAYGFAPSDIPDGKVKTADLCK